MEGGESCGGGLGQGVGERGEEGQDGLYGLAGWGRGERRDEGIGQCGYMPHLLYEICVQRAVSVR